MLRGHITYTRGPELVAREFRKVLKGELQKVGLEWHKKMLPKHFKHTAVREYGYAQRTTSYTMRKLRRYGHTRPLVWTGRAERDAKRMAKITGTSKRVRVVLSVPRYIYQYANYGKKVDKAAEMTATTETEALELAHILSDKMTVAIENLRGKETVKIG